MEWDWLRHAVGVARAGSFSQAAPLGGQEACSVLPGQNGRKGV
jgi:hypothetical protein